MLTRLEAHHYRCFERLGIDMGNFCVIVGANGSGKTTLLDIPVLLSELFKADNLASVFLVNRGDKPARTNNLRELIFAGRGDEFSLAIEARLPTAIQTQLVASIAATHGVDPAFRTSPERWPSHIRYELRLEVVAGRDLQVKDEYCFVFPEANRPNPAAPGVHGSSQHAPDDWFFTMLRSNGQPATFWQETPSKGQRTVPPEETLNVKPGLLALPSVKYRTNAYPAANWLYHLLTEQTVFFDPDWAKLHSASAPGQGNSIIASATNLPWLALDLKLSGLAADATPEQKQSYRSRDYRDWVDHVITALPQVMDIDVRVREEDQFAYFTVRYRAGHSVTSSGLSDGTLRILGLTLLAWVRHAPGLLVTEEPENGIHPGAIATILESLASFYDSQVWVTSHSPVVLASTELANLLCARQTESGGIDIIAGTLHPSLQNWRGDMNLGMLFATGILG